MQNSSSKTGLFLMELIIAILFFSLAGAVCVRLFVRSHIISEQSVELNHSVLWAQNTAEAFYGCNGDIQQMSELLDGSTVTAGPDGEEQVLTLSFDKDFNPVVLSPEEPDQDFCPIAVYELKACIAQWDDLLTCNITVTNSEAGNSTEEYEPVYTLTVSLFPNKEAANE